MKTRGSKVIALGLIVLGLGAILAVSFGAFTGSAGSKPPTGPTVVETMSPEQGREVEEVFASDPIAKKLIAGRAHDTREVTPWVSVKGKALIGGTIDVALRHPARIGPAIWPIMIPVAVGRPHPAKTQYLERKVKLKLRNVTDIIGSVDLQKGKVVGLAPEGPRLKMQIVHFYGSRPGPAFREPKGY